MCHTKEEGLKVKELPIFPNKTMLRSLLEADSSELKGCEPSPPS